MAHKTLTTPEGKELVVKEYITARERNRIRAVAMRNMQIDPATQQAVGFGSVEQYIEDGEKVLIEIGVVSYAGSDENILDRLLDSTPNEYDFVIEELGKLNGAQKAETK